MTAAHTPLKAAAMPMALCDHGVLTVIKLDNLTHESADARRLNAVGTKDYSQILTSLYSLKRK